MHNEGENVRSSVTLPSNFAFPPSADRSRGFDGVVLFDTCLTGRKLTLAMDAAATIVDATSSSDRLGLVLFGPEASAISELIMCTTPYKQALQSSIQQIKSTTSRVNYGISTRNEIGFEFIG